MIYKYTKCESVIAKIMADADLSEKNIRITDIREWIFEAMEKIGAVVQYEHKESGQDDKTPILKIEDCQIPIPSDLERLQTVAYSTSEKGPWIPVRTNHSTFVNPPKIKLTNESEPVKKFPTSQSQFYEVNMNSKNLDAVRNMQQDITYFIKPGWIVLNRDKGYVKLAYTAILSDERGYPMIPDLASYQEAIYWYVMMKLNFPKFLKGELGGTAGSNQYVYQYLQGQWAHFRALAYGEALMPNDGDMINIENEWNKLIPEVEQSKDMFNDLGKQQINYNDYYYGY